VSFWYRKGSPVARSGSKPPALMADRSGRVDGSFIDQQNRNIVPDRVDAPALNALQAFSIFLTLQQRFLAHWADEDVQQVLRNHDSILRLPVCTMGHLRPPDEPNNRDGCGASEAGYQHNITNACTGAIGEEKKGHIDFAAVSE
jgi:hypothetical protein